MHNCIYWIDVFGLGLWWKDKMDLAGWSSNVIKCNRMLRTLFLNFIFIFWHTHSFYILDSQYSPPTHLRWIRHPRHKMLVVHRPKTVKAHAWLECVRAIPTKSNLAGERLHLSWLLVRRVWFWLKVQWLQATRLRKFWSAMRRLECSVAGRGPRRGHLSCVYFNDFLVRPSAQLRARTSR